MWFCDHNYVIIRKNRARCILNKEILDLLKEESVSGVRSSRASLKNLREVYRDFFKRWVDRQSAIQTFCLSYTHIYNV